MKVQALIRSLQRGSFNDKPNATLTLETTDPLEIMEIRMFSNSIDDGTVDRLQKCVGKVIQIPLSVNIYKGNIQYQIPFNTVIDVPKQSSITVPVK